MGRNSAALQQNDTIAEQIKQGRVSMHDVITQVVARPSSPAGEAFVDTLLRLFPRVDASAALRIREQLAIDTRMQMRALSNRQRHRLVELVDGDRDL